MEPLPALPVEGLDETHRRMAQALTRRAPGDTCRALSALYGLFSLMGAKTARSDPAELIRTGYADPAFRCASLCRTRCLSDARLHALFVRRYGQTPRRYLETLRMRQARLALDEQRPVGETARCVGCCDVFQFSRAYRRFFGHSAVRGTRQALDGGEDRYCTVGSEQHHFNPRPPCGGRLERLDARVASIEFQSTSPVRGTTPAACVHVAVRQISIHVPRAGDDFQSLCSDG